MGINALSEDYDRAIAKIHKWKSNFLDLSSRNNQLNFNLNSKRYIELIHPKCADLFKLLLIYDQTFEFPPIYQKKKGQSSSDAINIAHQKALDAKLKKARLTEAITKIRDSVLNTRIKKMIHDGQIAAQERGINILFISFGLLKWKNPNDSEFLHSPLLFAPIHLESRNLQFQLLDDEIIVNPALKEKLYEERIKLPKFPIEFNSRLLVEYFAKVKDLIKRENNWELQDRAFIGPFDFAKASMYEDLDNNQDLILKHPIVKAIAQEEGYAEPADHLPKIEEMNDNLDPSSSFLILNADSSQIEAINYAKSGCSLVIQGPPGTGKSQCIANIIAECLGNKKKVLFIAQKAPALKVVQSRLEKCGLGDFCLLIPTQSVKKASVISQINESINRDVKSPKIRNTKYNALKTSRDYLNEYVDCLKQPFGKLKLTLYEILGYLMGLNDIPLIACHMNDPELLNDAEFETVRNLFEELEQFRDTVENYKQNPWRNAKLTSTLILSPEFKKELRKRLSSFQNQNSHLQEELRSFHLKYPPAFKQDLTSIPTQWERILKVSQYWIDLLKNSYGIWENIENDYRELNQYFILKDLCRYHELNFRSFRQIKLAYFNEKAPKDTVQGFLLKNLYKYSQEMEDFVDRITVFNLKSKLNPILSDNDMVEFETFFNTYHSKALLLKSDQLLARFTTDYTSGLKRTGNAYREDKMEILSCLRRKNSRADPMGHLGQIKNFQDKYGHPFGISPDTMEGIKEEFIVLFDKWTSFRKLEDLLFALFSIPLIPTEYLQSIWDSNHTYASEWLQNLPYLHDWFEVQVRRHHIEDLGYGEVFNGILNHKFRDSAKKPIEFSLIFEKAFYNHWKELLYDSLPPVANFKKRYHQNILGKFRKLDEEILDLNQKRLLAQLLQLRPQSDLSVSDEFLKERGFLERESKKKRNLKPLRYTFSNCQEIITQFKPCFCMSPDTISNILDLEKYYRYFDVIIFDEASQVTPEDAIGGILRGKSLVVVGDSKQLPPTVFFKARHTDDFSDEFLDENIQTMESLLDECSGIGFREKMLKFHYRSRKESLIAFSNQNYYNGKLFTFPDTRVDSYNSHNNTNPSNKNLLSDDYSDITKLRGIDFRYIPNGKKIKGRNTIEAKIVAEAIIQHYKNNLKYKTNYSLGVVAFSQKQQDEISDILKNDFRNDIHLTTDIQNKEQYFIKNLESVQGDERDFIFFSIGYAPDDNGKMSLNFGPLNQTGGYRRLNVAITRARYHVKIFSSFLPSDIPYQKINAEGLRDLVNYMKYAQSGQLPLSQNQQEIDLSFQKRSIEAHIKKNLELKNYQVDDLVGASDYRIDLAIVNPNKPSEYILGLECDGGAYQRANTARDRDRTRKMVMEGLGWHIYHVWTPTYFRNHKKILKDIEKTIESLLSKK